MRHLLTVRHLTQTCHCVNKQCANVQFPAKLAGGIILREGVMVVMETLTNGAKSDEEILCGVDELVVRFGTPRVGSTVDQPGGVQG